MSARYAFRYESGSNGGIALITCGAAQAAGIGPIRCQHRGGGESLGRQLVRTLASSMEADSQVERRTRKRLGSGAETGRVVLDEPALALLRQLAEADATDTYPDQLIASVRSILGPDAAAMLAARMRSRAGVA